MVNNYSLSPMMMHQMSFRSSFESQTLRAKILLQKTKKTTKQKNQQKIEFQLVLRWYPLR